MVTCGALEGRDRAWFVRCELKKKGHTYHLRVHCIPFFLCVLYGKMRISKKSRKRVKSKKKVRTRRSSKTRRSFRAASSTDGARQFVQNKMLQFKVLTNPSKENVETIKATKEYQQWKTVLEEKWASDKLYEIICHDQLEDILWDKVLIPTDTLEQRRVVSDSFSCPSSSEAPGAPRKRPRTGNKHPQVGNFQVLDVLPFQVFGKKTTIKFNFEGEFEYGPRSAAFETLLVELTLNANTEIDCFFSEELVQEQLTGKSKRTLKKFETLGGILNRKWIPVSDMLGAEIVRRGLGKRDRVPGTIEYLNTFEVDGKTFTITDEESNKRFFSVANCDENDIKDKYFMYILFLEEVGYTLRMHEYKSDVDPWWSKHGVILNTTHQINYKIVCAGIFKYVSKFNFIYMDNLSGTFEPDEEELMTAKKIVQKTFQKRVFTCTLQELKSLTKQEETFFNKQTFLDNIVNEHPDLESISKSS